MTTPFAPEPTCRCTPPWLVCLQPVCPSLSHPKGHPHCLPPGQACGAVGGDLGLGPCLEAGPHDEHRDRTGATWRARLDVETGVVRLREVTDLIDELVRGCGLSPFKVKIDGAADPLVQLTQYLEQQVAGVAEALTGAAIEHDHSCPVDCGPEHDAAMEADADRQVADLEADDGPLPDVDSRLSWMLRVLGDEFGPLGVLAAARGLWPDAARLDAKVATTSAGSAPDVVVMLAESSRLSAADVLAAFRRHRRGGAR